MFTYRLFIRITNMTYSDTGNINFVCKINIKNGFQDMEKWAKTLNAKKEKMNDFKKSMLSGGDMSGKKESAAADAGFAILAKGRFDTKKDEMLMPPPPSIVRSLNRLYLKV